MKYIILVSILFLFLGCSNKPIDAKKLYTEDCANCHGKFARKSALGKSQIIAGFSKEQIKNALNGYKEDRYGGSMKKTMKKQVSSLNKEEIDVLANYIFSLNH
jgi:cytochrome c